MRVLLAEDHAIVRRGTRLYLERVGVEVVGEATNGREAVQMARELRPDVVIMDIRPPNSPGWKQPGASDTSSRRAALPAGEQREYPRLSLSGGSHSTGFTPYPVRR